MKYFEIDPDTSSLEDKYGITIIETEYGDHWWTAVVWNELENQLVLLEWVEDAGRYEAIRYGYDQVIQGLSCMDLDDEYLEVVETFCDRGE